MIIVGALTAASQAAAAEAAGAGMIELRLDLLEGDRLRGVQECRKATSLPVIATLRSGEEGGRFFGTPDEWMAALSPLLPYVDCVDIEQRYAVHAPAVRAAEKRIIASCHEGRMLSLSELFAMERGLRAFGDLPKIIVTPEDEDDLIDLISFTAAAKKPICTGVLGTRFRHARAILPLFGSELVYCHAGSPTADGQYSVAEFSALMKMLR